MMSGGLTTDEPAASARVTTDDLLLHHEVCQFLYREARLQDRHEYDAWEALWTDDAVYWAPANGDDTVDPEREMSIIYDNRSRIALRVRQLRTGGRWTQEPKSRLCRVISNVEVRLRDDGELDVASNAVIYEASPRGEVIWPTRNKFVLRRLGDTLRMARKTVLLPNNDLPLYTMSFLI